MRLYALAKITRAAQAAVRVAAAECFTVAPGVAFVPLKGKYPKYRFKPQSSSCSLQELLVVPLPPRGDGSGGGCGASGSSWSSSSLHFRLECSYQPPYRPHAPRRRRGAPYCRGARRAAGRDVAGAAGGGVAAAAAAAARAA